MSCEVLGREMNKQKFLNKLFLDLPCFNNKHPFHSLFFFIIQCMHEDVLLSLWNLHPL